MGGGSGTPSFGVFLNYDPTLFGLEATQASLPLAGSVRTGMTDAIGGDAADPTYDLAWVEALPEDRLRAISFIRDRLGSDNAPISRHFLWAQLESRLYELRAELPSALAEFDAACAAHHDEMVTIRPGLMTMFKGIPRLELYRQAAIRHQKAGELAPAINWCADGLMVYGQDAIRPESVDDLRARMSKYQGQLQRQSATKPRIKREPLGPKPTVEQLRCENCGLTFERTITRGRKPKLCPDCRGVDDGAVAQSVGSDQIPELSEE